MNYLINIARLIFFMTGTITLAHAGSTSAPAGISFYTLRVIYPESEKNGVSLTAYNKSSSPYLIQSWIRPVDATTGDVEMNANGSKLMPFVVTPPLARLEANGELPLRIRRNDAELPDDRESVFFISVKALPTQKSGSEQMVMTVVSNLKIFYRPGKLLKRAVADVSHKLTFKREGGELIAVNPSPYWLTFSRLSIGNQSLEKKALRLMVPPFGHQAYSLPANANGTISWQLIDEDGWDTPVARQTS